MRLIIRSDSFMTKTITQTFKSKTRLEQKSKFN